MSRQKKDTMKQIPGNEKNLYMSFKPMCNICNKRVGHKKAHMRYNHDKKSEKIILKKSNS